MIQISLDVLQVDKSRLRRVIRADGTEAAFLDLVLFETPHSSFGDFLVKQDVTQEQRAFGIPRPIIGNARVRREPPPPSDDA